MATPEDIDCESTDLSVSCAFVALHLVSRSKVSELDYGEALLLGSAQLLGLLIERVQQRRDCLKEKLRKAEFDVREMKRLRREDANANDKVVSIFASHEQGWIAERRRLKSQIHALVKEIQLFKLRSEDVVGKLNQRVMEAECGTRHKEMAFDEEVKRREELEEKLQLAKQEAQSTFADLVSSQRHLEAEIGRALRQAEETKQELIEMFEKKEEAVSIGEKLSEEIAKMQKDTEQKDKILSAILRKSKLDSVEKEMLVKELKITRAKKKQAELEADRWRNKWESRQRQGSRSSHSLEAGCSEDGPEWRSKSNGYGYSNKALVLDYMGAEWQKERQSVELYGADAIANEEEEFVTADIEHLQNWVHLEIEKQTSVLEERHYAEVEAFTEQMRLKDEKLAAVHWQIVDMEVETKRLQSHIEMLNGDLSQLRDNNLKLESLLLDREVEIKSLKEKFSSFFQQCRKSNSNHSIERKSRENDREMKPNPTRNSYYAENRMLEGSCPVMDSEAIQKSRERMVREIVMISSIDSVAPVDTREVNSIISINEMSSEEAESTESSSGEKEKSITLVTIYPKEEIQEEKEVSMDSSYTLMQNSSHKEAYGETKLATAQKPFMMKDSFGKMDIHALGVSYKIKRLKQQLIVLEKLAGINQNTNGGNESDSPDVRVNENKQQLKGFVLVLALLDKQVKRFQSLEEKTDDLCTRMNENSRAGSRKDLKNGKTKEQRKILQSYLEETFQLQRYMVATGQKLVDIQTKISLSFGSSFGLEESVGFNISQFADVIRTLFREIQRGLELRIARIIGDIEGTLACNGILHM